MPTPPPGAAARPCLLVSYGSFSSLLIAALAQAASAQMNPIEPPQLSQLPPGVSVPTDVRQETTIPQDPVPQKPLPQEPLPKLPPAKDLLPTPDRPTVDDGGSGSESNLTVTRYEVQGSTIFSADELDKVTRPFIGNVSFAKLLEARSAITKLYVDKGYVTSGAFVPPQTLENGIVKIQVLEGRLEDIKITGLARLSKDYVRSRLAVAGRSPVNVPRLLEGLKLLQLDPHLEKISADLQAGIQPGTSLLQVKVAEADPFSTNVTFDNGRSPSVGATRIKGSMSHNNVAGMGDSLDISYSHTKGSDSFDTSYTFPINAYNGTLRAAMGRTKSDVIEGNFDILGIRANSKYYEFSIRQPIKQTSSEELALGLTFSRQESQTFLSLEGFSGPFKLSPGADERGQTKISAFRLFQEWNKRTSRQVLAARSQFSIGSTILNANESEEQPGIAKEPDSRFLSWRGQGQWVRLLAPDTLMLVKGDLQLADRPLVPLEQFSAGGQQTVRGYRQDVLLSDNGLSFSTEVRIPVWRVPKVNGLLQVAPFIDMARGWNKGKTAIENQTLLGAGIGLLWRQNSLSARLDWGIPLLNPAKNKETLQEKGVYFSINYSPF